MNHDKLITNRIGHWSRKYPQQDRDDLHQEAHMAYAEARQTYDSKKGAAFKTHANNWINWRLYEYCKFGRSRIPGVNKGNGGIPKLIPETKVNNLPMIITPDVYSFCRLVHDMSAEARAITRLVIKTPKELTALGYNNRGKDMISKNKIRLYLRSHRKWSIPVINKTFREIEGLLK